MENVIERIYKGNIENGKEFTNAEKYLNNMKEIATLLKQFKEKLTIDQRDDFNKLWNAVLTSNDDYGLAQFKAWFRMGARLAIECLSK